MSKYKEDIIRLRAEGKTYNQIVEELGCTKSTVCYYAGESQGVKRAERQRNGRKIVKNYIQKYKQETPCKDCGENYAYWQMDFDHLGDKLFEISDYVKSVGAQLSIIQKEMEKCDLVCSNCHRDRTHWRTEGKYDMDVSSYYE